MGQNNQDIQIQTKCILKKYHSYVSLYWKETNYLLYSKPNSILMAGKGTLNTPADYYNQTVRHAALNEFTLSPPQDAGDDTVPVRAAVIPTRCVQAQTGLSVDHEGAYKEQDDGRIDSYWFTLWSIVKIAQEIKQTELAYAE